ncbi:hypothetical protein GCM10027589_39640 [Actinocorallia lasiicapitis]
MAHRLSIDGRRCNGSGLCWSTSARLFQPGPDGRARVRVPSLEDARDVELALDVADCCPMEAVQVTPAADAET